MADILTRADIQALAEWVLEDGPQPRFVASSAQPTSASARNATACTEEFCRSYREARYLGLSQEDAATSLGVMPLRLRSMFTGEGVDPKLHKHLVMTELSAPAVYKRRHLETIQEASREGNWKAALQLLERTVPEYNPKQTLTVATQPSVMDSEEYTKLAVEAQKQLRNLREKKLITRGEA